MRARMAVDKRKLRLQAAINQFRQHAVESCKEFFRPADLQPLVAAHDGGYQKLGHVIRLVYRDLAVAVECVDGGRIECGTRGAWREVLETDRAVGEFA